MQRYTCAVGTHCHNITNWYNTHGWATLLICSCNYTSTLPCGCAPSKRVVAQCTTLPHHRRGLDHSICTCSCTLILFPTFVWPKCQNTTITCSRGWAKRVPLLVLTYAEVTVLLKEWVCEGDVPPPLRSVKLRIIHGIISTSKMWGVAKS